MSAAEYGTVEEPACRSVVVISSGGLTVSGKVLVALMGGVCESVTLTVTEEVPVPVGLPVTTPVLGSRVAHEGRPVADHLYGVSPPLAARETVYGTVNTPWGSTEVVIPSGIALTSSGKVSVTLTAVDPVTFTVTVDVPTVVGIPVISPVLGSMFAHTGRPVADHVYGFSPPVAVRVVE